MKQIKRKVAWFSCGAASAVAAKIAINRYQDIEVVYQDTGSEHTDNTRFLKDCEQWFEKKIKIIKSKKYKNIYDVFESRKYISGIHGAPCTQELKRKVAEDYIDHFKTLEVFGYTIEEKNRVEKFKENNPERKINTPLIEKGISKSECFQILSNAGIKLPMMYRLGYSNNNCIGCVKGQQGYWNKIKKDFPAIFEKTARLERKLNAAINKKYIQGKRHKLFLDELQPNSGKEPEPDMSCGLFCHTTDELK